MFQRLMPLAAAVLLIVATGAKAAGDPGSFVADMGTQAIRILQTQQDAGGRRAAFTKLFTADFDTPSIGRFVLGRYWRTASPDLQKQYLDVFQLYVVKIYADRFAGYSGQQFKVTGAQATDAATSMVSSQIIQPNGAPPIDIGWQVVKGSDGYKVTDVTVSNLSLAITKRDEFASVIQQNGGSIQALIDLLKAKSQED